MERKGDNQSPANWAGRVRAVRRYRSWESEPGPGEGSWTEQVAKALENDPRELSEIFDETTPAEKDSKRSIYEQFRIDV